MTATLIHSPGGVPEGIAVALTAAALAGLINGIGVGVFRVHPLIVTLGMSFIVLGFANVWQLQIASRPGPACRTSSGRSGPAARST